MRASVACAASRERACTTDVVLTAGHGTLTRGQGALYYKQRNFAHAGLEATTAMLDDFISNGKDDDFLFVASDGQMTYGQDVRSAHGVIEITLVHPTVSIDHMTQAGHALATVFPAFAFEVSVREVEPAIAHSIVRRSHYNYNVFLSKFKNDAERAERFPDLFLLVEEGERSIAAAKLLVWNAKKKSIASIRG